jgi:hypothetical protein
MKFEWVLLDEDFSAATQTLGAQVPGGVIFKSCEWWPLQEDKHVGDEERTVSVAMVFVPGVQVEDLLARS